LESLHPSLRFGDTRLNSPGGQLSVRQPPSWSKKTSQPPLPKFPRSPVWMELTLSGPLRDCTGKCIISFSDAMLASRRLQLFATSRPLTTWDTWNTRLYRDLHKGTFLVSSTGAGPATVVEDFGLTFSCPWTTTNRGYEVGLVGNND